MKRHNADIKSKSMFYLYIKQAISSPLFYIACLFFALSRFGLVLAEYGFSREWIAGLNYYTDLFLDTPVNVLSIAICCLPYALSYQEEKQNGLQPYLFIRQKPENYLLAKFTACGISSFLVAFIGYAVPVLTFYFLNDGVIYSTEHLTQPLPLYKQFLLEQPFLYYLLLMINNALHCSLWPIFAMMTTVFIDDIYLIVGATDVGYVYSGYLLYLIGFGAFAPALAFSGGVRIRYFENIPLAFLFNYLEIFAVLIIIVALAIFKVRRNYERQ